MMANRWNAIIQTQGLHLQSVSNGKIAKFNVGTVEGFGILDHEVCFVNAHRRQSKDDIEIWDNIHKNFFPSKSTVPPTRLANPDLSPDTKVKRCENTNMLFNTIYTWTSMSNVFWLAREIGIFCK